MSKLDRIYERLSSIDSTLAQQHESLKDHIRRTEILESKVEPIELHVTMMTTALKWLKPALLGGLGWLLHKNWPL